MKSIQTAQAELNNLKNDVIGIYKDAQTQRFELILEEREDSLTTINITQFGAIQTNYGFQKMYGEVKMFPDNKNMNDMLNNPFEWDAFMKQF